LVDELIRLKVDVIVAGNTAVAMAAKKATKTIPIVMAVVSDPVARGLIAGFARPGGNVTGLSPLTVELAAKQSQLLKETLPRVSRVAVLWNPSMPAAQRQLKSVEAAAPALGLQLQLVPARGPDEFDNAFAGARERAGAPHVLADPMFFLHRVRLADCTEASVTRDVRDHGARRGRWPHGVLGGFQRFVPASRHLRG
jgi:putative ABC transport system substrate-binding protein